MNVIEEQTILERIEKEDNIQVEAKIYYKNKKQERSYLLTYYMKAEDYKRHEIIKKMRTLAFFKGSIEDKKITLKLERKL